MSRKQSVHVANKAKLNVSKRHKSVCNKLYERFRAFTIDPWADDKVIMAQLQSAANGPVDCDPVQLCIHNQPLLSLFITQFIVTLRKKSKGYEDDEYIDMRICDDNDLFYAAGSYKGAVSSLIGGINRAVFDYVARWKIENVAELAAGDIPDFVHNPPQIDIETNGQWINVKSVRDELVDKCFNAKGIFFYIHSFLQYLSQ